MSTTRPDSTARHIVVQDPAPRTCCVCGKLLHRTLRASADASLTIRTPRGMAHLGPCSAQAQAQA